MAKANSKAGAGATTIKNIMQNSPLSHAELSTALHTFFMCDDSLPTVWSEEKLSMARCPVLVGEAGCGKTTAVRNYCRKYGLELRFSPTGASLDEDGLGIPEKVEQSTRDRLEHDMWMNSHPDAKMTDSPVFKRLSTAYSWTDARTMSELSGRKRAPKGQYEVSNEREAEIGGKGIADSFLIKPPAWFPSEPPRSPSGKGILFIDELFTASEMQQNQISLLITNRGYGGMHVAPGWFIMGASNPPTDAYYLSRDPDARLLARLWIIPIAPTPDDTMRHFSDNQLLTDRMYGFLLMNKQFITSVDNRTWEDVGYFEKQHELARTMTPAVFRTLLGYRIKPELIASYEAYCRNGDDPYHYPISAINLMSANEEEHKAQMIIVERWVKDEKTAHIGASAHDLIKYTSDPNFILRDAAARNIGEFMNRIPNSDLICNVLENMPHGPNQSLIYKHIYNSPTAKKLKDFFDMERAENKESVFTRRKKSK